MKDINKKSRPQRETHDAIDLTETLTMSLGGFGYPLSPIPRSLGYYQGAAAVMTKSPAMWNARSSSSSGSRDRGTLMTPTTVPIHSGFYGSLLFRDIIR